MFFVHFSCLPEHILSAIVLTLILSMSLLEISTALTYTHSIFRQYTKYSLVVLLQLVGLLVSRISPQSVRSVDELRLS